MAEAESRRTGKQVGELPVTLILGHGSTHPAEGMLIFIDRAADAKTGTFRVRAQSPNPDVRI